MNNEQYYQRDNRGAMGDNARREQAPKQEDIRRVSLFISIVNRMPAACGEVVSKEIMAALTLADDSVDWRAWLEVGR